MVPGGVCGLAAVCAVDQARPSLAPSEAHLSMPVWAQPSSVPPVLCGHQQSHWPPPPHNATRAQPEPAAEGHGLAKPLHSNVNPSLNVCDHLGFFFNTHLSLMCAYRLPIHLGRLLMAELYSVDTHDL